MPTEQDKPELRTEPLRTSLSERPTFKATPAIEAPVQHLRLADAECGTGTGSAVRRPTSYDREQLLPTAQVAKHKNDRQRFISQAERRRKPLLRSQLTHIDSGIE